MIEEIPKILIECGRSEAKLIEGRCVGHVHQHDPVEWTVAFGGTGER